MDGTLIEAWASMKRVVKKDGTTPRAEDGGRNPTVSFKGEPRSNEPPESTTDPDARLYKKSAGDKSRLCSLGHALMENRQGLAVAVETPRAGGTAAREAAMRDAKAAPHVAQKAKGSASEGRATRHAGDQTRLKIRKRIEEIRGWAKTVGGLRQARFVGLAQVSARTRFTLAAYHLTRRATRFGWRLSTL